MDRWSSDSSFPGTERFEVLRRLGEGGMGVVYEALDRERNLRVALKTLRNLSSEAVLRFKNEFRALQDIGHPNLVSLGDLHEDGGHWFFTMELLEGSDLLSWVRGSVVPPEADEDESTVPASPANLSFDEERLRSAMVQLTHALEALHAAGKVHRDIKPSNVRVTHDGRVVLLDFGLVTDVAGDESASGDGNLVGTTLYMAPEQAASLRVGPEADWYALGCVLYEVLTGQLPFSGPPLAVLLDKQRLTPQPPHELIESTPADLDALCVRLLLFDPKLRASGRDVLRSLRASTTRPAGAGPASASATQTPPFVGRAAELTALGEAFDQTRRQQVATAAVRGPSGVGKSALVREFTAGLMVRLPKTVLLAGKCHERESVPYKAFDGAMDALSRHLRKLDPVDAALIVGHEGALVARLFPALARVPAVRRAAPPLQEIPNPQELRNRAFAALRVIMGRLAQTGPLVLTIDDFQWADADSVTLLQELLRKPDPPPLLLLLTMRPGVTTGVPEDARVIDLGGLPDAEAQALVGMLAKRFATHADAAALAREAEGHPMFLAELVQHVAHVGEPAAGVVRLEDALLARIGRLDERARRLLDVLAVAGAPIPLRVAALAAGLEPSEAARSVAVLRVATLTRSSGAYSDDMIEPYHDRIREAVFGDLDADSRRALHSALADALEGGDPRLQDPHMLLRQLEAAGQAERAGAQAERAALVAREALAFEQAAGLYRAALRLGKHSDEARRAVQLNLGDALANAGRCAEAAEAFFSAAEGAEAASRLEYRRRAAEQLLLSGHVDRGMSELRAVLADVDLAVPDTPRRALMALVWERIKLRLRGLRWKPRDLSQISRQDLERLELHKTIGQGLSFVDTIRGFLFHARGLMLALRAGERMHLARALVMEAVFQGSDGVKGLTNARKLLAEGRRIAEGGSEPYLDAYVHSSGGVVSYFAGHFEEAARSLLLGEAVFRDQTVGTAWELNHSRLFLLHAFRQMGQFSQIGPRLDGYMEDAMRRGDRFAATTMARSFNILYLARDDVARARRELAERAWSPPVTGFLHLQHWFELKAEVEVDLYEGRTGVRERQARAIQMMRASMLMRPQPIRCDFLYMCGRIALAEGPDRREARRMAGRLMGEGVGYARAWGLLLRAGLAMLAGLPQAAIPFLEESIQIADSDHLGLIAAVARRRLGELLGAERGRSLLSSSDTWMRSESIVRPDRMAALVTPGFPPGTVLPI